MRYHELVMDPKYCENFLHWRTNGVGSSRNIRSSYATTPAVTVKFLQGIIESAPRDSSFFMSVMQLIFLVLIPKNEISTYLVDHFSNFFIFMYYIVIRQICVQLKPELDPLFFRGIFRHLGYFILVLEIFLSCV